ncbi:hypothetical protein [Arsenicicoccus dermatophilus]|uniref:hypothetical protein n=1 Tax=Arsenicicoccus dermatophilus TaxID=1076331 RepID=UPI003916CD65
MGDPRLMSLQQRYETWADHALAVLIETAAVHQTAITYGELAHQVQERSGIHTDVPAHSWLGKVLAIVHHRTTAAGEPDLVALAVLPGGAVGPTYDAVRTACGAEPYGEERREQAAAEARLACNRRYAHDVPEEAQPLLHPITSLESTRTTSGRAGRASTRPATRAVREPRPPKAPRETKPRPPKPRASDGAIIPEREDAFCPRCFLQLPLSGVCVSCD